jgi:dTDP-3,4-didehydro-2,6-dideoxy-alpha-D-glucose 3-reductase
MDPRPEERPPLRFGVLGCADVAWRNTLPAMGRVAEAELVAVASRDGANAHRFAERFGAEAVKEYAPLLERPDIDAVYIAVPTGLHHTWAMRALEAGKHVLVEKPLTTGLAEAGELVTTARAHGRWLMDNFMFLHHSQHAAVRDLVDAGRIGEPRVFSSAFGIPPRDPGDVRYRADLGGGALLDVGVYTVRAAQLFAGDDLSVEGSLLSLDATTGVDLDGSALLSTPGGVAAELTFGFRSSYRSEYAIWGSEGRVTLERAFTPPAALRPILRLESQDHREEITLPADDQFANLIRAFARSALDGAGFEAYARTLLRHAALVQEIRDRARRTAV